MFRLTALLGLLALPAAADVAEISNCHFEHFDMRSFVKCDVTNQSTVTIAGGSFELRITEQGRSVPWVSKGQMRSLGSPIPGGIEPQETRTLLFWSGNLDDNADREKLVIEISQLRFLDVNGDEIGSQ